MPKTIPTSHIHLMPEDLERLRKVVNMTTDAFYSDIICRAIEPSPSKSAYRGWARDLYCPNLKQWRQLELYVAANFPDYVPVA